MSLNLFHHRFRGTDEVFGLRAHYLQHPLGKLHQLRLPTGFFQLEFTRDIEVEYVQESPYRMRVMITVYCLVPALDLPARVLAFLETHLPQILAFPEAITLTLRVRGVHLRECERRLVFLPCGDDDDDAAREKRRGLFSSVCLWYELDPLLLGDSADVAVTCGDDNGGTVTPLRVLAHLDRAFRRQFAGAPRVVSAISLTYLHQDLLVSEPFWNTLGGGFTRTLVHWMILEDADRRGACDRRPFSRFHLAFAPPAPMPMSMDVLEREVRARALCERRTAYQLMEGVRVFLSGRAALENSASWCVTCIVHFLLPCAQWVNPRLLQVWCDHVLSRERAAARRRAAKRAGKRYWNGRYDNPCEAAKEREKELIAFSRALDFSALAQWNAKTDNAVWWAMFCNRIDEFVYYYAPYVK